MFFYKPCKENCRYTFIQLVRIQNQFNILTGLKDSKAKSKVIILLTDGSNNRGDISPLTAAEIAKQFGIRIYTIGVGTNGTAPYPMQTYAGTQYVNPGKANTSRW